MMTLALSTVEVLDSGLKPVKQQWRMSTLLKHSPISGSPPNTERALQYLQMKHRQQTREFPLLKFSSFSQVQRPKKHAQENSF
jgi:hypothetical protein